MVHSPQCVSFILKYSSDTGFVLCVKQSFFLQLLSEGCVVFPPQALDCFTAMLSSSSSRLRLAEIIGSKLNITKEKVWSVRAFLCFCLPALTAGFARRRSTSVRCTSPAFVSASCRSLWAGPLCRESRPKPWCWRSKWDTLSTPTSSMLSRRHPR